MATIKRQKIFLPPSPRTLSKKEKEILCGVLFTLKVLDGYSSNPINHVSMKDIKCKEPMLTLLFILLVYFIGRI